jgi:hypothetical protein
MSVRAAQKKPARWPAQFLERMPKRHCHAASAKFAFQAKHCCDASLDVYTAQLFRPTDNTCVRSARLAISFHRSAERSARSRTLGNTETLASRLSAFARSLNIFASSDMQALISLLAAYRLIELLPERIVRKRISITYRK